MSFEFKRVSDLKKNSIENRLKLLEKQVVELQKTLMRLVDKVERLEEAIENTTQQSSYTSYKRRGYKGSKQNYGKKGYQYKRDYNKKYGKEYSKGYERRKKTGIEIMREQGVIFESDLKSISNKNRFFNYLRDKGVIVLEGSRERIAVTEEYLNQFLKKIGEIGEEAGEKLEGKEKKLFEFLRENGYLLYSDKKWILNI